MFDDDLVLALSPIDRAFSQLEIRYFVGGSVASSFRGAMRSTMDVDLVADLFDDHVKPLLERLSGEYYASEPAIRDAIIRKASFNLIHLATSFKIDVFVNQQRDFDKTAFGRATIEHLGSKLGGVNVPLATVEDIMLAKLKWYRLGDETSERQWEDLFRLSRLHRQTLDWNYLGHHAKELEVGDLLERLRTRLARNGI